jgi:iron complex outermembrane recepter protein
MSTKFDRLLQAIALAMIGWPMHASAEVVAAPAATLEEVTVTAQRRDENLQDVPIAVTALSADRLAAVGVQTTAGLTSITPALTFSNVAGFLEPRIRGIGNASAGPGVENAVATYVDGVYISSSPGSLISLSNVARVEVLKGPQGTLFGRNATGGLIQVVTKDPSQTFSGNTRIGLDNYNTVQTDLYLTGPINDAIAADLSVSLGHQGRGYGNNTFTGDDTYRTDRDASIRSKWLIQAGASTTLRVAADISQHYSADPELGALSGTAPVAYRATPTSLPIIINTSPWDTFENDLTRHKTTTGGGSVKLDQDLGGLTFTSISAYRQTKFDQEFDADLSPAASLFERYTQKDRQISQEFQLASALDKRLQWLVGAYYFHLNSDYDPFALYFGTAPQRRTVMYVQTKTESFAGFGQATFEVVPNTNLTAGFRYTEDKRALRGTTNAIPASGSPIVTTAFPSVDITYNTPTWRLSLDHKFTDDLMAYVSYNRGYKSGGYNAQSPTAPAYEPEHLDAYELGIKSEALEHRLRLNAETFYYNYKNIQVNTYIGSLGVIYNGAAAETYGLDVDFECELTNSLTINGGLVLLHDRFTDFPRAAIATPVPGVPGTATVAPGPATGNRLPFAPDATITVGFDYKMEVGAGTADLTVNELYSSGFYSQPDNLLKQSSYNMVNGSLSWSPASERYTLTLWGTNLLNKAVAELLAASASAYSVSYQPPRVYGIRASMKF